MGYNKMKSAGRIFLMVAATLALFAPSMVMAQDVATGTATANVLAVLAVTATHALAFGDVMQGVPHVASKIVVADAGVFNISGEGGQEVAMYMQLPDYLWNSTNTDRLVISFSITDADLDTTAAGTPAVHGGGAITDVNPHNLPATDLGNADNVLQIFLGGTVFPTVDQRAAAYSADIILTVSYTGN
jgi:hypothetical protein